jgi:hypothetical protein
VIFFWGEFLQHDKEKKKEGAKDTKGGFFFFLFLFLLGIKK